MLAQGAMRAIDPSERARLAYRDKRTITIDRGREHERAQTCRGAACMFNIFFREITRAQLDVCVRVSFWVRKMAHIDYARSVQQRKYMLQVQTRTPLSTARVLRWQYVCIRKYQHRKWHRVIVSSLRYSRVCVRVFACASKILYEIKLYPLECCCKPQTRAQPDIDAIHIACVPDCPCAFQNNPGELARPHDSPTLILSLSIENAATDCRTQTDFRSRPRSRSHTFH